MLLPNDLYKDFQVSAAAPLPITAVRSSIIPSIPLLKDALAAIAPSAIP